MSDEEKEVRYFVSVGDMRDVRYALDKLGIPYRTEVWQPGIRAVYVSADADVSSVFGYDT